jgi:general nucleoside transport system ATP-binding protein
MQKMVLARTLSRRPQVILAHQPTRGLDVANTAHVHQQLLDARQGGAGILLISEDLDELIALSDQISVMYRGCISQPVPVSETNTQMLGLMMSGQGYEGARPRAKGLGYAGRGQEVTDAAGNPT